MRFCKLVARFNDLNPGVDHIAGNWFGTRDEDGDQARPDRGKPRQPQTQDARINHRGSRVIGRHYVGTRQRAAIGRHLVSPARDMLHIAAVDENSSVSTTKMTTAEESVV